MIYLVKHSHQHLILSAEAEQDCPSLHKRHCFQFPYLFSPIVFMQSAAAPLLLLALLLFKAPEVFTLRTLLALEGFGTRSHQPDIQEQPYMSTSERKLFLEAIHIMFSPSRDPFFRRKHYLRPNTYFFRGYTICLKGYSH